MLSDTEIASMTSEKRSGLSHRLAIFNGGIARDTDASRHRRRRLLTSLWSYVWG
jgi:hypothetical protein